MRWQEDARFCAWMVSSAGGNGYIEPIPGKPGRYDLKGLSGGLVLYMYEAWRGGESWVPAGDIGWKDGGR